MLAESRAGCYLRLITHAGPIQQEGLTKNDARGYNRSRKHDSSNAQGNDTRSSAYHFDFIMSAALHYPHLTYDLDGTARVDNTRYKVIHLAGEHYHFGWSAEEILRQHPDLRPEQVYASLTYFYDHRDQLVRTMEESATGAEADREGTAQPISRAELLRRHSVQGS